LLILDLDETLVYAAKEDVPRVDFSVGPYDVMKRPHLDPFLEKVSEWFDLAVWTSSSASYARVVVGEIFPRPDELKFVWCSDRCTVRYDHDTGEYSGTKYLRKLKKMGYRLERVLMLDDTPGKHTRNYGNLVPIRAFEGDVDDAELRDVLSFLDRLRGVENVRTIEKRYWRRAV
jgi:RNA polymerase II subunit A small phosphatase-like protein